jgi:hypothetical protein
VFEIFEFYFNVVGRWLILLGFLIGFIIKTRELLYVVFRKKLVLLLCGVIYFIIFSIIFALFNTKSFLTMSKLDELETTEGYCSVDYGAKRSYINVGSSHLNFDVSLWISKNRRQIEMKIDNYYVKFWHKNQMVYQISKDDEIIFSIDDANQNIEKYNLWIVPLEYFMVFSFSLFVELVLLISIMSMKEKCEGDI